MSLHMVRHSDRRSLLHRFRRRVANQSQFRGPLREEAMTMRSTRISFEWRPSRRQATDMAQNQTTPFCSTVGESRRHGPRLQETYRVTEFTDSGLSTGRLTTPVASRLAQTCISILQRWLAIPTPLPFRHCQTGSRRVLLRRSPSQLVPPRVGSLTSLRRQLANARLAHPQILEALRPQL